MREGVPRYTDLAGKVLSLMDGEERKDVFLALTLALGEAIISTSIGHAHAKEGLRMSSGTIKKMILSARTDDFLSKSIQ